jgi:hypothetical protein
MTNLIHQPYSAHPSMLMPQTWYVVPSQSPHSLNCVKSSMKIVMFFLHQHPFPAGVVPIRSHSASIVIVSPTFPPDEIYEILISVETPVAKSPFDAAAKDLNYLPIIREVNIPSKVDHCGNCPSMEDSQSISMEFLNLKLCCYFPRSSTVRTPNQWWYLR